VHESDLAGTSSCFIVRARFRTMEAVGSVGKRMVASCIPGVPHEPESEPPVASLLSS
jgi:hypothetical protein